MKKSILSFLLLAVGVTAFSQGTWKKTVTEADELKGEEAGNVFIFTDPNMGSFVLWDWNKCQFRLTSTVSQFNIDAGYNRLAGSYAGIEVKVGIYGDDDKLIEKFVLWLDREDNTGNQFVRTRDAGGMFNPVGQKGKVKKIFKTLQSGKGYVRIVTERFNNTDYDLKITPYKE